MPCQDQTEQIEILLDEQERIVAFSLSKISCGQPVGGQELMPFVAGQEAEALRAGSLLSWVEGFEERSALEQFLLAKQFFSLQAALAVYLGERTGQVGEPFVLEELVIESDLTRIKGLIEVDLISEEIKSCGSCKKCRSLPEENRDRLPLEDGALSSV